MDRIVNLLSTDNLSSEECQAYLNRDAGSEMPLLFSDLSKLELALNLFLKQKKSQVDFNKLELLQVASGASSNIADGVDVHVKLISSRLLLAVCTTSVSSAFGILSSHVLNQIMGIILKLSVDLIHNRSKKKKDTYDDDDNEDGSEGLSQATDTDASPLAPSLFLLLKEIYSSTHLFWQRSEDYLLDAFSEALIAVVCLGAMKQSIFMECSKLAGCILALFACQNEDCMMMTYRNLLPIVTLSGRDMKLPDAVKYKVQCHQAACKIVIAVVKSSQGILTMWRKHSPKKISSAKKTPRSKQKDSLSGASTPGSSARKGFTDVSISSKTPTKSSAVTPMTAKGEENKFPAPFACALGLIQRLLLIASERVIPRSMIISSAVNLISALHNPCEGIAAVNDLLVHSSSEKKKSNASQATVTREYSSRRGLSRGMRPTYNEKDESEIEEEAFSYQFPSPHFATSQSSNVSHEESEELQNAVSRILSFIVKLSKSAKLNHRSLSLDIGSSLLREEWLVSNYQTSSQTSNVDAVLQMLLERCSDVAATVRSRSLGALWDLLESLANSKKTQSMHFFSGVYNLFLGGFNPTLLDFDATSVSFLDRLRELACDNKPLVRVKAIQALVLALTIEWPRLCIKPADLLESTTQESFEYVQLFLSDDDVSVISERCSDESIAVRKQAVTSLSAILQCRPLDSLLQEAWIDAVLPLILDPESSVQLKVTQCVFDVILLAVVEEPSTNANEAAWSICSKIGESGCTKLLQTAVTSTKKNGLLRSTPEKSTSLLLHEVLESVKQACCVMLGADGKDVNDDENIFLSQDNFSQDIQMLRHQDFEVVSTGAWILLEALTAQSVGETEQLDSQTVSADFVVRCWLSRRQHNSTCVKGLSSYILDELEIRMLRVMAKVSSSVKVSSKRAVCSKLRQVLNAAQCDAQGVSAAINVLLHFSNENVALSKNGVLKEESYCNESTLKNIQDFSGQLLNVAHEILYRYIWGLEKKTEVLFSATSAKMSPIGVLQNVDETLHFLSCALSLVGEISMLGFSVEEDEDSYTSKQNLTPLSMPTCLVSETSGTFKIHIPDVLVTMVQILMGHQLPDSASVKESTDFSGVNNVSSLTDSSVVFSNDSLPNARNKSIPNKIRAQAFVVMGKLCLRSRRRARDHVNVFLRELKVGKDFNSSSLDILDHSASALSTSNISYDRSSLDIAGSHAVRSNSLIVLGDLCVRFTNLVDRHVGSMSSCLQDPNVMVRRHAFVLLTQLLLQEYIKWRGMLLFRFLAVVVDKNEEIAELSKYVLRHTLQTKYNGFMVQNFSEAIIVFNNCSGHATYRATAAIGADGGSCAVSMDGIDLSGPHKRGQRMQIYQFMMEDITEEDKIQITANLSQDILAYALDFPIETSIVGGGVLSPFESALEDAFAVLRSPLLRVGSKRGGSSSQGDDEDDAADTETVIANEARYALHKAKTKVLKKLSVQHLVDHMLPVVSSLKHYLECKRSPVQKSLMEYLMHLVNSHKAEVALALSSDPGLKDEIEYDIKLYEREKNEGSKRNKIHAAEKAVLNLEKSTARKSLSKSSAKSRLSPTHDGFADRMTSGSAATSRRSTRNTPLLNSSTSGGGRRKRSTPHKHASDLSGRLGMDSDISSPRTSSTTTYVSSVRKWSVNIGDLDDSSDLVENSHSNRPRGRKRGTTTSLNKGDNVDTLRDVSLLGSNAEKLLTDDVSGAPIRKKVKASNAGSRRSNRSQNKGQSDSLFSL